MCLFTSGVHTAVSMGSEDTENRFSPCTVWLSQTELNSLHLAKGALTCKAIIAVPGLLNFRYFTIKYFLKSCYSTKSFYSIGNVGFVT